PPACSASPFAACATDWNDWGLNRQIEMKKPEPQATCLLDLVISKYRNRRHVTYRAYVPPDNGICYALLEGETTKNPQSIAGCGFRLLHDAGEM
ncbi:MAG: hypothetical protein Q7U84_09655, partial [Polynucleobacter sp.]|nr:hypothetical protein [Polynucleobacter sp.]